MKKMLFSFFICSLVHVAHGAETKSAQEKTNELDQALLAAVYTEDAEFDTIWS